MDYLAFFELLEKQVHSDVSIQTGIENIISFCSSENSHDDWNKLGSFDYQETEELDIGIRELFKNDPPADTTAGLWFGIFNPVDENDQTVADFYVSGSDRFDPDPEDNSWAVGPDWWPENRYANSRILSAIYRIAYSEGGLGNDAEYPLCLAYTCLVVRDLLNHNSDLICRCSKQHMGVAAGFDSGDFLLLGKLTRQGLIRIA